MPKNNRKNNQYYTKLRSKHPSTLSDNPDPNPDPDPNPYASCSAVRRCVRLKLLQIDISTCSKVMILMVDL